MPSDTAETKSNPKKTSRLIGGTIGVVIALAIFYFLSIGPALKLAEHGTISDPAAEAFYRPTEEGRPNNGNTS
jgi:hypothetical protein